MAHVSISDLRKSYGAIEVIHGVSFDIEDGQFVVLVGPSGCGKSTLLRMVAGLESVTAGRIAIDAREVNRLAPKDRDIAMVFQNYALYPQMTVAQNMGFALEIAGHDKRHIRAEVQKAAAILGLEPLLQRKPAQLSGGQRQRVAMGRAIVRDPKVFLFDEPLSNLDAKLRSQMRTEIKALHHRLRSTIIYVTHDQIEAMTMADRIVVMNDGNVEQIGTPLELYDNPRNLFVAGFLGAPSMNFLEGRLDASGTPALELDDGSRVTLPRAPAGRNGARVVYGIRPEALELGDGGTPATIVVVEPTGAETHVVLSLGGTEVMAIVKERLSLDPGAPVSLRLDRGPGHFFDPETGRNLEGSDP